jgi:hypothetical protein
VSIPVANAALCEPTYSTQLVLQGLNI